MVKNFKAWPEFWPKEQNYPEVPIHTFLDSTTSLSVGEQLANSSS